MNFKETKLEGCYEIEVIPHEDNRGWFARTFCKDEFKKIGHDKEWVQINHSFTKEKGTLRGMHFQNPPNAEIKLIRCIAGKIFDVAIDLRKNSPSFLKWFGVELSAENKKMIYIPEGCAHGFLTLTNDCEIIYHHTNFYTPSYEDGINYQDPAVKIEWPEAIEMISHRDKNLPKLPENFKGIII
ncbi:MAG: dTDP-4-dehydrorhamnose 3,5-epimerase [Bacteroidota bacterium]|nr:dTDP-4-dehydrorhamnose 3,5-epimerase [Bacteroidota bacterium]